MAANDTGAIRRLSRTLYALSLTTLLPIRVMMFAMAEALDVLFAHPIVLLATLAVGAAIGMGVEKFWAGLELEKRRAYWRGRKSNRHLHSADASLGKKADETDAVGRATAQLKVVMGANFAPRALLNKPERRLLSCIESVLTAECPGYRAMGQVSLGEILSSPEKDAYFAINAKRVDLLIVDPACRPVCAIEFQGTGHHVGPNAAARDAVKKEALRRAGLRMVEVVSGDTPSQVRQIVRRAVALEGSGASDPAGFGKKKATA